MDLSLFQYSCPKELVAQEPLAKRDASRMMVLDRNAQTTANRTFRNFPDYLLPGDLLVLNDTKVFPARLFGETEKGRGVEILLLKPLNGNGTWRCLTKPFRKIGEGSTLRFGPDLQGTVTAKTDGFAEMAFTARNVAQCLEAAGLPPIPPYIRRNPLRWNPQGDKDRYQTVFAKNPGSAAAPTASFHFTKSLLQKIQRKGVEIAYVTLHVSTDTFLPIREKEVEKHRMHGEDFVVPEKTAAAVRLAKKEGRRVIAAGTTVVRVLESDWTKPSTDIFIHPGHVFKIVDAMLTNFHQSGSTPLLMVSALAGREPLLKAYAEAIREKYRLFSYGDCMFVL